MASFAESIGMLTGKKLKPCGTCTENLHFPRLSVQLSVLLMEASRKLHLYLRIGKITPISMCVCLVVCVCLCVCLLGEQPFMFSTVKFHETSF